MEGVMIEVPEKWLRRIMPLVAREVRSSEIIRRYDRTTMATRRMARKRTDAEQEFVDEFRDVCHALGIDPTINV
jgi:hypothetical protein